MNQGERATFNVEAEKAAKECLLDLSHLQCSSFHFSFLGEFFSFNLFRRYEARFYLEKKWIIKFGRGAFNTKNECLLNL